ncbi:MAG: ABC transporter substrate-binding protein [Microbacterium sp.]|uniref:ABC transporter substrate-binding protein n=1 Tax=Microbacterium sp. TaxID=51671 RepID=UPI0039E54E82
MTTTSAGENDGLAPLAAYLGATAGPADAAREPLTIGWVTNAAGPFAQPDVDRVMLTAVALLNERFGGVGGRPLAVRRFGVDGSDDESAAAAAELLADPAVRLVLEGSMGLGGAALHRALGGRIAVAVMSPIGRHDLASPGAYCLTAGSAAPAPAFAHYLTNVLDVDEVAVVRVAFDRTSDPIEAAIRDAMAARGGVARVGYYGALGRSPLGWTDQTGVDRAVADAGVRDAQAVVLLAIPNPETVALNARALERVGYDGPVLALPFGLTEQLADELGDLPRWTYMAPDPLVAAPDPTGHVAAYLAAIRQHLPGVDPGDLFMTSVPAFGSVMTLARILAPLADREVDRDAVRAAIAQYRGPVFLGPPATPVRADPDEIAVGTRAARWYGYRGDGEWSLVADWAEPRPHADGGCESTAATPQEGNPT